MSIPNLPVNFKDDILASSNPKRKYQQTFNTDGSVSLEDVTQYKQKGSEFGASQVNQTNGAINDIYDDRIVDLDSLDLVTEPGFFVDALAVSELNGRLKGILVNLKWGSGISAVEWSCICKNNRVVLNAIVDKTQAIPANTQWKICTIPSGYRPEWEVMIPIVINAKSAIGTIRWASVRIDLDGSVYIISTTAIDTTWYIRMLVAWDI